MAGLWHCREGSKYCQATFHRVAPVHHGPTRSINRAQSFHAEICDYWDKTLTNLKNSRYHNLIPVYSSNMLHHMCELQNIASY